MPHGSSVINGAARVTARVIVSVSKLVKQCWISSVLNGGEMKMNIKTDDVKGLDCGALIVPGVL